MTRSVAWRDVSFAERGIVDPADSAWRTHLTTLFPEVRPRGHFEVRSCDAIDARWYAAPIVFLAGLAYDDIAAREASILAAESRALLRTAGESGLRDPSIARTARDLFQLALAGARRLGDAYCGGAALETAAEFFATYTARDRSPADDRVLPEASSRRLNARSCVDVARCRRVLGANPHGALEIVARLQNLLSEIERQRRPLTEEVIDL